MEDLIQLLFATSSFDSIRFGIQIQNLSYMESCQFPLLTKSQIKISCKFSQV